METDNSVDLKVVELLKEVQLEYSHALTKFVDDAVSSIKDAIGQIPEDLKVTADLAPGFVRDIECLVKPEFNVDLFVQLPKECFLEKDYLNYRYHAKRCMYLCVIKKYLTSSALVGKVEWSTFQNEVRKPVLIVYPVKKLVALPGFFVRIIPTAPSLFSIPKLNLQRNNVRAVSKGGIPQATPKYNSSILEDMFIEDTEELVKQTFLGSKELQEGLILLKVGARRRAPIYAHDCLNGFLISVILAYLVDRNHVNKSMKAMQIFRVTMKFIATSDFWKHDLYFIPKGQKAISKEERLPFKESFPTIICPPSRSFNLAFRITRVGFLELQNESTMTLACIEKCRDSGFEEVFMTKIDYPVKYDHVIRLNLKGKSSVYVSGFCLDDECWRVYEQKVYNVLSHGLSDRVKTVPFRFSSVFPPEPHPLANEKGSSVKLNKFPPSCIRPLEVMIQLEGSGNWPMDDVAVEKTKSAFLLKIGESLQNSWGMTCTATEDDVDVFVSGYAFRLKIWHERGLTLMRRETGNEHVNKVSNVDKELYFRSQHSSMINGLQTCYPAYGPVVRLAKRWAASHLFSACLEEEAVELLVAYIFLRPLPFNAPCSRITGFLRFLRLLSDYDWTFSALVVDINNDLTPNDEKEIRENFMLSRKGYEENPQNVNSAMFLATAYDKASEAWTRFSPNSVELKRLVAYAGSSANLLTKLILEDQSDSYRWECLFRTPLNNYDAVILLHREKLPYPQRLLFPSELHQGCLTREALHIQLENKNTTLVEINNDGI
ncbi:hypothetical protein ACLB2K_005802 [Fragaria x ananassa]